MEPLQFETFSKRDLVILGLKPQVAASVLADLATHLDKSQIVVSLMAGVSTAQIEEKLPEGTPVVRVMPQTLVRLRAAACALCAGRAVAALRLRNTLWYRLRGSSRQATQGEASATALIGSYMRHRRPVPTF